ncbi:MAG: helix-turn-helix domain-containing protein [Beijerinckiaceae bacterium]
MRMKGERQYRDRFMLIGPERVFYAGLLGKPQERLSGALTIYTAMEGKLAISFAGGPSRSAEIAVVAPFTAHSLTSECPEVCGILIEPETVASGELQKLAAGSEDAIGPHMAERVRSAYATLRTMPQKDGFTTSEFDRLFFDTPLAARRLDRRIARATARLRSHFDEPFAAPDCARAANLSMSRFLHLFKDETGFPFRAFRAWKRARNLLHFANQDINLAHLALDLGYPDSTHFSHSIRRFYGLQPREIFSGSRRLAIFRSEPLPH